MCVSVLLLVFVSGSGLEGEEVDDYQHAGFGFEAFGQTLDGQWWVFEVVESMFPTFGQSRSIHRFIE